VTMLVVEQRNVRVQSPAPRSAWRSVLDASDEATAYHTPEWLDAACETAGLEDVSKLYEGPDGRHIVLPMVRRASAIPGMTADWSMPPNWGYGGIISSGRIDADDVATVLPDLLAAKAGRTIVKPGPLSGAAWNGVPAQSRIPHLVHVVDLRGGFAHIWSKRFSSGARNKIRKAEKAGVEIAWDTTGRLLRPHYDLYLRWARRRATDHGLPVALALRLARRREPYRRFEAVARRFGDRCRIGVAWIGGEAAASTIILRNGVHAHYWRSAIDRDRAARTYANHLLLASALEEAAGFGCEYFHMGESGGVESLMQFKEHVGGERRRYDEYRFEHPIVANAVRLREHAGDRAIALGLKSAGLLRRTAS
jgi:Acetyltransferase (GNAT) domain